MNTTARLQIGKAGITQGTIQAVTTLLKHHKHLRITVLKSSGRNRESIKAMAQEIIKQLTIPCQCAIIGFTIVLRRRSQPSK